MPLYEYRCDDCHTRFELLVSFANADNGIVCQKCHSERVHRLVSVFATARGEDSMDFSGAMGDTDFGGDGGGCCGGSCGCGH
jgi:putative FmdB family regulatory protein